MNKKLFRNTFLLFIAIGLLNYIGNRLFLYWTTWWHDMILHFISGFVISMTVVLVYQAFFKKNISFKNHILSICLIVSFVVGVAWEVFELYFKITSFSDGIIFWRDTISDLFLDVLGAFFGAKYSYLYIKRDE